MSTSVVVVSLYNDESSIASVITGTDAADADDAGGAADTSVSSWYWLEDLTVPEFPDVLPIGVIISSYVGADAGVTAVSYFVESSSAEVGACKQPRTGAR